MQYQAASYDLLWILKWSHKPKQYETSRRAAVLMMTCVCVCVCACLWCTGRSTLALSRYTVFLGSRLRTGSDRNRIRRALKSARIHPSFKAFYSGYDIAVLTLSEAAPFNDYIRPVCLVSPQDLLSPSLICYSTGWGLTNYSSSQYRSMRFASFSFLQLSSCVAPVLFYARLIQLFHRSFL